jgi:hypothetical protein
MHRYLTTGDPSDPIGHSDVCGGVA